MLTIELAPLAPLSYLISLLAPPEKEAISSFGKTTSVIALLAPGSLCGVKKTKQKNLNLIILLLMSVYEIVYNA